MVGLPSLFPTRFGVDRLYEEAVLATTASLDRLSLSLFRLDDDPLPPCRNPFYPVSLRSAVRAAGKLDWATALQFAKILLVQVGLVDPEVIADLAVKTVGRVGTRTTCCVLITILGVYYMTRIVVKIFFACPGGPKCGLRG